MLPSLLLKAAKLFIVLRPIIVADMLQTIPALSIDIATAQYPWHVIFNRL